MLKENLPEKLISYLPNEAQHAVTTSYQRMKEVADARRNGEFSPFTYKEIALPPEWQKSKKVTFIWALIYTITFNPIMLVIGSLLFPIAVLITIVNIFNMLKNGFSWVSFN